MEDEQVLLENKLNPFKSAWINPRAATRYALDNNWASMLIIIILLTASGIIEVLTKAVDKNFGDTYGIAGIIVGAIFFSTLIGFMQWFVAAGFTYFVGKWLGGKGSFRDIKTAYLVSYIPYIALAFLWIIDVIVAGPDLFKEFGELTFMASIFIVISSSVQIAIGIWAFIIALFAISEAHGFSLWKAFLTVIIPIVILVMFFMLIGLLFSF